MVFRRDFIKQMSAGAAFLASNNFLFSSFDSKDPVLEKVTILHTNDVHSRIDAFPMDGSRNEGLGGAAKRAAMISKIRSEEDHVLLLDAGDYFQGTPYFNFYAGELEMKLMSAMKYDAVTIGNHDFDAGLDGLEKQLKHADFPLIVGNYDFSDTLMNGKTKDYQVFEKGDIRIGVTGVGIELESLVPKSLTGNTQYLDPIKTLNDKAAFLKNEENCDFVICLSHLGYAYDENRISDLVLAKETENVDLIIGGHTHTFLRNAEFHANKIGKPVAVNQVGWAGIMLGRLDIYFEKNEVNQCVTCKNFYVN